MESYTSTYLSWNVSQRKEALPFLYEALSKFPSSSILHYYLAITYSLLYASSSSSLLEHQTLVHYQISLSLEKQLDTFLDFALFYRTLSKYKEMESLLQTALTLFPSSERLYNLLGTCYCETLRFSDSIQAFQKGLVLPSLSPSGKLFFFANLGCCYIKQQDYNHVISTLTSIFPLSCSDPEILETIHLNLALAYFKTYQYALAEHHYQITLKVSSSLSTKQACLQNLASLAMAKGQVHTAISYYDTILSVSSSREIYQNKLYASNFLVQSPQESFTLHRSVSSTLFPSFSLPSYSLSSKIKIGIVSADFCAHPVSRFLLSFLRYYDRSLFDVVFYSNTKHEDEVTSLIQTLGEYHSILNISDEEVAKTISSHSVSILLDVGGHTADNRLNIFSFRPAPIQVSFLGYPNTTGMTQMTHRLVDSITDEPFSQAFHTEKLVFLSKFLCFDTLTFPSLPIPDLPTFYPKQNTSITFGVFHIQNKISQECLELWNQLLSDLPWANLFFHCRFYITEDFKTCIYAKFPSISKTRILFSGVSSTYSEYLQQFDQVDVCLDTFPYSGTTVTCESLLRNKPVITLYQKGIHRHNVSPSILFHAKLQEWVARDKTEYLCIAKRTIDKLYPSPTYIRDCFLSSLSPATYTKELESIFQSLLKTHS